MRFYLPAIDSSLRKAIKSGDIKKIVALWSPRVYKIHQIYNSNKEFNKPKYMIVQNINELDTPLEIRKVRFYANDLQRIGENEEDIDILPSKLNIVL